jgi:NAD(P)-dependent dehydrogenase (short-subunit alcohol dehydrogenase family)
MNEEMKALVDRPVAMVTGGSRGIGLGIALSLAIEGCDIVICGRREPSLVREAVEQLQGLGSKVLYCMGDVSDADARAQMVSETRDHFGRLNILVNNAGVAPKVRADVLETTEESFEWVMKTNLQGPFFLTQLVANWMVEQKKSDPEFGGCIVNISSISATVASVSRGEYCISKAGISMATKLWATRLGEFDIPVYEIRPGVTKTDMTAAVQEKYDKLISEGLCIQKRWGFPEDVGKAVAMMARGDIPYSTGQVLMVDGGLTLPRL